jgi:hypothetical protein
MLNNSNDRLIAVLEPVRELLRYVESKDTDLCDYALEVRLGIDREIEHLRQNGQR